MKIKPYHEQIKKDLKQLGIREGGVLLVHSALGSLGKFPDKATILTNALFEVLGESGTLLMPALSYEIVTKENPVFDQLNTPSNVGYLTEYFRQQPGVIRSLHPTHSVSGKGPLASKILGENFKDTTPCGKHSPFVKLRETKGQVLFLGCGMKPNTSMHAIEELVIPEYLYSEEVVFTVKQSNGEKTNMKVLCHDFEGWVQRYDRLEKLLSSPDMKKGKILNAGCHLVETEPMWKTAHKMLKKNPLYFIDRSNKTDQ